LSMTLALRPSSCISLEGCCRNAPTGAFYDKDIQSVGFSNFRRQFQ